MGKVLRFVPKEQPAVVHDRRSRDTVSAGHYAPIEVDDPYAKGEKILVFRQLRHDQLAWYHAHHRIDDGQYEAGRAYQRDWEAAERGARAIDPTKEKVDGGLGIDPLPVQQIAARSKLVVIEAVLGRMAARLVHAVLVRGVKVDEMARNQSRGEREHTGRQFRDALEVLAVEYGLSQKNYHRRRRIVQPAVIGY
jgi:hypothetical protein